MAWTKEAREAAAAARRRNRKNEITPESIARARKLYPNAMGKGTTGIINTMQNVSYKNLGILSKLAFGAVHPMIRKLAVKANKNFNKSQLKKFENPPAKLKRSTIRGIQEARAARNIVGGLSKREAKFAAERMKRIRLARKLGNSPVASQIGDQATAGKSKAALYAKMRW